MLLETYVNTNTVTYDKPCSLVGLFDFGATAPPQCARASSFSSFLDHTQRPTTVGTTTLDE